MPLHEDDLSGVCIALNRIATALETIATQYEKPQESASMLDAPLPWKSFCNGLKNLKRRLEAEEVAAESARDLLKMGRRCMMNLRGVKEVSIIEIDDEMRSRGLFKLWILS